MKVLKILSLSVAVVVVGVGALVLVRAPTVHGQRADTPRALTVLAGRGAEIGVSIRDVESSDKAAAGGVVIEEVRPDSPAEKAGLKRSDVVVEFDGEQVRSARQFTRLVQETAPGRAVKATVVRDGQRKDVQITPSEGRESMILGDRLRQRLDDLPNRPENLPGRYAERLLPPFDFNFDLDGLQGLHGVIDARGRLGVAVEELTPQLATYFGAKDGVLVASVTEDSPASRAGLKAGDVITKVNNETIESRSDLLRALREVKDDQAAITIMRDRKETTVTVKLESRRASRVGRPA